MSRPPRIAEADLARPVLAYLREEQWEVFQEVAGPPGTGIGDIVATLGQLACVVETKVSLTFEVIDQARKWLPWAHWAWVAVPKEKGNDLSGGRRLAYRVCRDMGIGVMVVKQPDSFDSRVAERIRETGIEIAGDVDPASDAWAAKYVEIVERPSLQRRADAARLRGLLKPEHKTYAVAGGKHGKHWSPFQATCREVRRFLEKAGGSAELSAIVKGIPHHYSGDSAARASLVTWIEKGSVEGVATDRSGKRIVLRLKTSDAGEIAGRNHASDHSQTLTRTRSGQSIVTGDDR